MMLIRVGNWACLFHGFWSSNSFCLSVVFVWSDSPMSVRHFYSRLKFIPS